MWETEAVHVVHTLAVTTIENVKTNSKVESIYHLLHAVEARNCMSCAIIMLAHVLNHVLHIL